MKSVVRHSANAAFHFPALAVKAKLLVHGVVEQVEPMAGPCRGGRGLFSGALYKWGGRSTAAPPL